MHCLFLFQLAVVSHGSVIEHGTHDELKNADGGYSALLSKYMKAVKGEEEEDTQARSERDNVFYTVSNKKLDSMRQIVVRYHCVSFLLFTSLDRCF